MKHSKILIVAAALSVVATAPARTYSDGFYIVNEDWYGHQNSTVNFLHPDDPEGNYWEYRVFQEANPGHELGCTNQYGAIHRGRLYLIAKQERDPGSTVTGGRITVADASTMEMIYQSTLIDPSGEQCDGRAFVGYDDSKGYISSSHGVWVFNLNDFSVSAKCVEGTENPNGHSEGGNTNSAGALYHGQCGTMVVAADKVFVAHQQYGLLRIDPATDIVDATFTIADKVNHDGASIGSVVKALDGNLYVSVTRGIDGLGDMLPYLVRVEPATLDYEVIALPEGIYPPASSWYAWTPDAFCASEVKNTLYWNGGENSWFSGSKIFKYDIDAASFEKIIDLDETGDYVPWKLYGCSMRLHPETDEMYMSLFHEFGADVYITRRCDADGKKIRDYDMIANYWFPSLPVFPTAANMSGAEAPALSEVLPGITAGAGGTLAVSASGGLDLVVYNLQGAEVRRYTTSADGGVQTFVTGLARGIYIARVGTRSLKFSI